MKQVEFRISTNAIKENKILDLVKPVQTEIELRKNLRQIAHNLNLNSEKKVGASLLYSSNLLTKIYLYVFEYYLSELDADILKNAFTHFVKNFKQINFIPVLSDYIRNFPPSSILFNEISVEEHVWLRNKKRFNYENEIIETIISYLLNENKAVNALKPLFSFSNLTLQDDFDKYIKESRNYYFQQKPIFEQKDIFTFLIEPIEKHPDNIQDQLDFIKENWAIIIKDHFNNEFLQALDLFKEDEIIMGIHGGQTPTIVPKYKTSDELDSFSLGKSGFNFAKQSVKNYSEHEAFTDDVNWMPNVVMIAKNIFVWLDQLSKKYNKEIKHLDKIPDEELKILSESNINSLWLIGVWERSNASRRIKHIRGNIDAVASAYSLFDYVIANELGGEEAYKKLNEKAWKYGIRLAADMVPNHTGIYSKWMEEHPDYFIQRNDLPFPNYSFTGEDLSSNPDLTIQIEDGYWTNSDAAVVFKYYNHKTKETKYIYHGNDGTNMPWNDTAQLDILKQEVREAVIQKIMDVARKFSVIRFDAAMTLTKKHFSRLWYPQPGTGGDIPTRSDFALSQMDFDTLFPVEFWREVVDRINNEMPETLLLAEAFWLMEGYFVRTLGMHRVYNSAFMHMFMREENEKYHELIKNTLEFEPEILKRYVNFMSNPDEETAIKQFGTGDKYFGVLTMMLTLPGLPMFAHGQIEGYHEKYGMEYKRAYYAEFPNQELVEKHKRQIFPLVGKRFLFSEVKNFWLYDYVDSYGNINNNVFAFSNMAGNERGLVLFNNKYEKAHGKINISSPKLVNGNLIQTTLINAFQMQSDERIFIQFKEITSGMEFLYSTVDFENGFEYNLNGFEYKVFTDFSFVYDDDGSVAKLYNLLNKKSVNSIEQTKNKLKLKPIHDAILNLFDTNNFEKIIVSLSENKVENEDLTKSFTNLENRLHFLVSEYLIHFNGGNIPSSIDYDFDLTISAIASLYKDFSCNEYEIDVNIRKNFNLMFDHNFRKNLIILVLLGSIREIKKNSKFDKIEELIEELILKEPISEVFKKINFSDEEISDHLELIDILFQYCNNYCHEDLELEKRISNFSVFLIKLQDFLNSQIAKKYLKVNEYQGVEYFRKENFEELLNWFFTLFLIEYKKCFLSKDNLSPKELLVAFDKPLKTIRKIVKISQESNYDFSILRKKLSELKI